MSTELILKSLENGVLWLTLNNEKQRNPLSSQMLLGALLFPQKARSSLQVMT